MSLSRLLQRLRQGSDLGATIVEYGLVVSVIGAGLIGGVNSLTTNSGTKLQARGAAIGMPDDGGVSVSSTSTTAPPASTTTTAAPTTVSHVSAMVTQATIANSRVWVARVTMTVQGPDGSPVANATITGAWTIDGNGEGTNQGSVTSCVTNAQGQCPVTRDNLDKHDNSVTFTMSNITGSGLSWTPGSDTPASATIVNPGVI